MSKQLTLANLTDPREAMFVAAIFDLGGPQHATAAALRAGYGTTREEAERAGALLLGSSRINRVITGEIRARFDVAAAAAFATLVEVCTNPKAPANARITAAQEILNRSSIGPIVSRSAVLKTEASIDDLIAQLDAAERNGKTIDGTATARHDTE